MPQKEDLIDVNSKNRLPEDEWSAQKEAEIIAEDETIKVTYAPQSTRIKDLLKLTLILTRAALRYPRASFKALLYFFRLRKIDDTTEMHEPKSESLREVFEILLQKNLPSKGSFSLTYEECWNDILILSHIFAKQAQERLNADITFVTKLRWGLAHGLYNSIVHGDPDRPIQVRWQIEKDEFFLQIVNTKNEERMKRHDVSINGIPISGVGGSLVIMRLIFDYFNLSEVLNANNEEDVRLTLIFHRGKKRNSLRYQTALRVADARDFVQLERILR